MDNNNTNNTINNTVQNNDAQGDILDLLEERLDKHETIISLHEEKINNNTEELKKHDNDIIQMKIDTSVQKQILTDLTLNMSELNNTIKDAVNAFNIYKDNESKLKLENIKWAIGGIMIPIFIALATYVLTNLPKLAK